MAEKGRGLVRGSLGIPGRATPGSTGRGKPVVAQTAGTRRFVRLLPVLLIGGGLLFDSLAPPNFTAVPLFVAAPLIAAP
ncbi:hypothetical protein DDE05_01630, partial [Streptomyces cavourensis]